MAGAENPYQFLMIQGLNSNSRIRAINGINDRFFGILKTAILQKPDYIHFDWIESFYFRRNILFTYISIPLFFIQLLICKLLNIKIAATIHNLSPHDTKHSRLHAWVNTRFLRLVKKVRVFNRATISILSQSAKLDTAKFHYLPEGNYINYYPNSTKEAEAKKHLNINSDLKVILFFGMLKPYKGITELVRSFNELQLCDTLLLVAGKSLHKDFKEEIPKYTSTNILIKDQFVNKDDVQYYFKAAEIVVLPFAKIENSGSLILAMGFKKPIVAPETEITRERLKHQTHLLYKNNDLQDKIKLAMTFSKPELEKIGQDNFNEVQKNSWIDFSHFFLD